MEKKTSNMIIIFSILVGLLFILGLLFGYLTTNKKNNDKDDKNNSNGSIEEEIYDEIVDLSVDDEEVISLFNMVHYNMNGSTINSHRTVFENNKLYV